MSECGNCKGLKTVGGRPCAVCCASMPDPENVRGRLSAVKKVIEMHMPPHTPFALFAIGTDAKGQSVEYVSNADRGRMINAMKQWIAMQEARN